MSLAAQARAAAASSAKIASEQTRSRAAAAEVAMLNHVAEYSGFDAEALVVVGAETLPRSTFVNQRYAGLGAGLERAVEYLDMTVIRVDDVEVALHNGRNGMGMYAVLTDPEHGRYVPDLSLTVLHGKAYEETQTKMFADALGKAYAAAPGHPITRAGNVGACPTCRRGYP